MPVDTTPPVFLSSSPAVNAQNVHVGTNLVLNFSEAIRAGSGNIEIRNASDGSVYETIPINDTNQVSFSGNTLTINPNNDLQFGTDYYVTMISGVVQDLAGNNFGGIASRLTQFRTETSVAPTLENSDPPNGSQNVPRFNTMFLDFSELVKAGIGSIEIHNASDGSVFESFSIANLTINSGIVFVPVDQTLLDNTSYYVTIAPGVITDLDGNGFAGITSPSGLHFTTRDTIAPTLVGSSPTNSAANVPLNANIVLTFSEPIYLNLDYATIEIRRSSDDSVFESIYAGDTNHVTVSGNQVTIVPLVKLNANTDYYVAVQPSAFRDGAGNAFTSLTSSTGLHFSTISTADTTPPTLIATSPADDATNVPVNTNIVLTFSEPIKANGGSIKVFGGDGSYYGTWFGESSPNGVVISGNTLTLPVQGLSLGTSYYVQLDATAVQDLAGNGFAGISSPTALNFITTAIDSIPPLLTYSGFLGGMWDAGGNWKAAVDAKIVLYFNEPVKAGSGHIQIRRLSDDALVEDISPGDTHKVTYFTQNRYSASVTIDPHANLDPYTSYYVLVSNGAIQDLAGNAFSGISSSSTFNFTTGDLVPPPQPSYSGGGGISVTTGPFGPDVVAPSLIGILPSDNATSVPIESNIVLTFNEAVKPGTGSLEIRRSSDGSLFDSISLSDTSQVTFSNSSSHGYTITINPLIDLQTSKNYYIVLQDGAVQDLSGNSYAGFSSPAAFNFTTAPTHDTTPPVLTKSAFPGPYLELTFSEPIRPGTGNIEYHSAVDGALIKVIPIDDPSQVWIAGNVATITPDTVFDYGAYYVTIAPGVVKDLAGNSFAGITSPTAQSFVLTQYNSSVPLLLESSPAGGFTGAPLNSNIVLTFSEPVRAGTGSIFISDSSYGYYAIPAADTSQVAFAANQVIINPKVDFPPGANVTISWNYDSIDGNSSNTAFGQLTFTAASSTIVAWPADSTSPLLLSSAPADNTANLPINPTFTLTFDEAVKAGSGNIDILDSYGDEYEAINIGDSSQVSFSGTQVVIHPNILLKRGASYSLSIGSGIILDTTGNSFPGTPPAGLSFKTVAGADVTAPVLVSATPNDNATGVSIAAPILLTFSEPVRLNPNTDLAFGPLGILVHDSTDGSVVRFSNSPFHGTQVLVSGNTVTLWSSNLRAPASGYYVTIDPGVLTDLAGNSFMGISSPTALNFTTAAQTETTPPVLVSSTPSDNAAGVGLRQNIVLTFSEPVQPGVGTGFTIHWGSNFLAVQSAAFSGNTVTIDPGFILSPGMDYWITAAPNSVLDMSGNAFTGLTTATDLNFTTGTPSPLLTGSSPTNSTTDLAANIVLTFNTAVKSGSGNVEIRDGHDGSLVESIPVTNASRVAFAGNTVTIDPSANYVIGHSYYVVMAAGVIKDLAGNDFVGLGSSFNNTWFTATLPFDSSLPVLTAVSPADNALGVPVSSNIVLTFNKSVRAGTGYIQIRKSTDGSLLDRIAVSDTIQVTFSGDSVIVNPTDDLAPGTAYYLTMDSGAVTDLSSNSFAGITGSTALNFVTAGGSGTAFKHPPSDFNADTQSDILWQGSSGQAAVWLMNGPGLLGSGLAGSNPGSSWRVVTAGDFDVDGRADILWQDASGQAAVWFMNGTAVISGGVAGPNPGPSWHAVAAGDFNGDGRADILWQSSDGTPAIWLMNGTTELTSAGLPNPGTSWHVAGIGDFNGDGKADILWQNDTGQAAVWLMNGTSVLGSALVGSNPGSSWRIVAAGDFNGDGDSDILWQNSDGTPAIWFMNGTSTTGGGIAGSNPGSSWRAMGTGDFNADGKSDILWQNIEGTPAIWLMNGTSVISGGVLPNPGSSWHLISMSG
jgi:methionine-rich copper-binding protein CopC